MAKTFIVAPDAPMEETEHLKSKRELGSGGIRLGLLDNSKANAGTLMLAVARTLQERYGAGEIVKRDKPVAGPPTPQVLDVLAECDFALVGSAD